MILFSYFSTTYKNILGSIFEGIIEGCALAFLCVSLFNHDLFIPKAATDWFYIIVTGLLCTALPIQMMLFGLKRISASQVAILSVLEPVTTLVVGMLFMHESSSILQILGVFLLLFSAVMIQMVSQPNQIVIES